MSSTQITTPLADLAATIRSEHEQAMTSLSAAVAHALQAGAALLEARAQFRFGDGWAEWLATEVPEIPYQSAMRYMRVARHPEIAASAPTLVAALDAVRGEGAGKPLSHPPALRDEAVTLYAEGVSAREIARRLDIDRKTVKRWADPGEHKRQIAAQARRSRKWKEAQAALRQKQRDAAVKKAGGPVAEGYSMLRKTAQALDRAYGREERPEIRAGLSAALSRVHAAEDEIVRALRMGAK